MLRRRLLERRSLLRGHTPTATPSNGEALRLAGDGIVFVVGVTSRRDAEMRLGPGITYPAAGWQTWLLAGTREQTILSAFFSTRGMLIGIEHYHAKTDRLPSYAPSVKGPFRLFPGDIALGNRIDVLPKRFVTLAGAAGSVRAIVYEQGYETRWNGGVALVSGNDNKIERLALYGVKVG